MVDQPTRERDDIVTHMNVDKESTANRQQDINRLFNTHSAEHPTNGAFDNVPVELLAYIFEGCVALEMKTTNNLCHDTSRAPWPLTRVCSRWRQTAHSTPSLWTAVHVSVDSLEELARPADETRAILSRYLERSQPLPIAITIMSEDAFPDSILIPILDSCERWNDLFLFTHPDDFPRLAGIRGRLPILRTLKIIPTREGAPLANTPVMFEIAPSLQEITLGGHALDLHFALPWAQTREFDANYTTSADVLPLLPLMPALVRLKLGLEQLDRAPADPRAWGVTHPGVQALTLNIADGQMQPGDIIDCLTLPWLTDLEVECPAVERVERTRQLVLRSRCTLDALTLVITFHCMGSMETLFRLTPQLRSLTVFDGVSITNRPLLEALVVPDDDPGRVLLPKLETITLLASRPLPEADVHRWLDAFESRVHPKQLREGAEHNVPVSPLRSILMGCTSGEHIVDNEECVHRFHQMMDEGVKVDLWYGPDLF